MRRLLLCAVAIAMMMPVTKLSAANNQPASDETRIDYIGEELSTHGKSKSAIKHQVEVNVGFITGGKMRVRDEGDKFKTNFSRPYLEVIYGARLHEYFFAGVGVGAQYAYGECRLIEKYAPLSPETWGVVAIPIYGNVKACFPASHLVTPYISVGVGGNVVATSNFSKENLGKMRGGLYCKFGAGLTIGKFNFGLGMTSQNMKWLSNADETIFKVGINSFYVEAGVKF